jgi:hypothetical protein
MDRARTFFRPLFLFAAAGAAGCLAAAACIDTAAECALTLGRTGCVDAQGSVAGSGGTTSTASTGMTGGGGTTACTDAGSCPAVPPGPCASLGMQTCVDGKCGVAYPPTTTNAPSQQYGSCKRNVCNPDGTMTTIADDSNVYDSGNPCITYGCNGGTQTGGPPGTLGAPCQMPGTTTMGYCEPDAHSGVLTCAECKKGDPMACSFVPGTMCAANGACLPSDCLTGTPNPSLNESDFECGGACLPCAITKKCNTYKDCASLVCFPATGGTCLAPTCSDGRKNGTETDIDCGGGMCLPCGSTLGCLAPTDCLSGVCKPSGMGGDVCQKASCTDGVQNGCETGVDCGYMPNDGGEPCQMCPPCATDGGM